MADKSHRNDQQRTLDNIIGHPPLIKVDLQGGSLYQAYVGAITAFDARSSTFDSLVLSYRTLKERTEASKQDNAKICLNNFTEHFNRTRDGVVDVVKTTTRPLTSLSKGHRPQGSGTRRQLAPGRR